MIKSRLTVQGEVIDQNPFDKTFYVPYYKAKRMLPSGGMIEVLRQTGFGIVGFGLEREILLQKMKRSLITIPGTRARRMGLGLVIWDWEIGAELFIQTKKGSAAYE